MADYDVLIAGGGPAGCATALSLRDFAPALRVCVADAAAPRRRCLGETLPPQAGALLGHLGVGERFVRDGHAQAFRTQSAWGSARLVANEFLYGVQQTGWHLDRARFDASLGEAVRTRGADWRAAQVQGAVLHGDTWTISLRDAAPCTARFLIDATGRRAGVCRQLGVASARLDNLIACVVRFAAAPEHLDLTVETFAGGWWYATALPNGERVLACMSDNDIVRREGYARLDGWMDALAQTTFVRRATAGGAPLAPPQLFPAASLNRVQPQDRPFLAVGDAASAFDPLSSQGIAKALRSGVFASYAAADYLVRADASGLARYRRFLTDEFAAYTTTLTDYYRRETRWAERPFWQRRHAAH